MWVMTAVSTITAAILSGSLLVRSHIESVHKQLQATGTSLTSLGISDFSELEDFQHLNFFIEEALQMDKVDKAVRVYDQSLKLIYTTFGATYDDLPTKLEQEIKKPMFIRVAGKQRVYESLIIPYKSHNKQKQFYLQVVIPLPKYPEVLAHLWWQVILLLGLLIGISIALSRMLAKRLLKPVDAVANYLMNIDPHKIERLNPLRLDTQGQYLQSIVDGINVLGTRTKEAIIQLSKMSRYVAHELRTPLTILQGEAETVLLNDKAGNQEYRKVLESSLEEIRRMSEIVNTVLKVGERARSITLFNPQPFDLVKWSAKNRQRWERTLGRSISYDAGGLESVTVKADPDLLFRLVDNLVRNTKDHTPSSVACSIKITKNEKLVQLIVEDNGPGLPQNVIDSLNSGRSTSLTAGVGLSLCLKIAEICGIILKFSNQEKGGLKIDVQFFQEAVN